jgi:thiamine pyrophosphate-dependent acetolactate synthase large subunit-like protein
MANLTNQTKTFFINRIKNTIQEKIDAQEALVVNKKELEEMALSKYTNDIGIVELYANYCKLNTAIETLEQDRKDLKDEIEKAFKAASENSYLWNHKSVPDDIRIKAIDRNYSFALDRMYPEVAAEIERLKKLMDNVEGAVLLASTDSALRITLTNLLERYGGDISDIEEMLPQ